MVLVSVTRCKAPGCCTNLGNVSSGLIAFQEGLPQRGSPLRSTSISNIAATAHVLCCAVLCTPPAAHLFTYVQAAPLDCGFLLPFPPHDMKLVCSSSRLPRQHFPRLESSWPNRAPHTAHCRWPRSAAHTQSATTCFRIDDLLPFALSLIWASSPPRRYTTCPADAAFSILLD